VLLLTLFLSSFYPCLHFRGILFPLPRRLVADVLLVVLFLFLFSFVLFLVYVVIFFVIVARFHPYASPLFPLPLSQCIFFSSSFTRLCRLFRDVELSYFSLQRDVLVSTLYLSFSPVYRRSFSAWIHCDFFKLQSPLSRCRLFRSCTCQRPPAPAPFP